MFHSANPTLFGRTDGVVGESQQPPGRVVRTAERRDAPGTSKGPKIIVQYRQRNAKIYELESNGAALEVRICHTDETPSNGWRVDARSRLEQSTPVGAWGTTAADALGQVARAWVAHSPALRTFDWEAIARVLHVVQAI